MDSPSSLREGFWASITAIAVVQSELVATASSARDQFAGAAIGGLLSAIIALSRIAEVGWGVAVAGWNVHSGSIPRRPRVIDQRI